jgi:hypothetical protein
VTEIEDFYYVTLADNDEECCDTCDCQDGRHYCMLHGIFLKNMDLKVCVAYTERPYNDYEEA